LKVTEPKEYYDNYNLAQILVEGLDSDPGTVEAFCLSLTKFDGEKAGYFLSALISASEGNDFTIHTQGHGSRLGWLGFGNTKRILVLGDVEDCAGHIMESGYMEIEGDAGYALGSLRGGVLTISGDAAGGAGEEMSGGKLVIGGNAGEKLGDWMSGGEIHVAGEIESVGKVKAGRIFHKGELIVDR
jgi:formylmethanofuran dehydrogenase subunit C